MYGNSVFHAWKLRFPFAGVVELLFRFFAFDFVIVCAVVFAFSGYAFVVFAVVFAVVFSIFVSDSVAVSFLDPDTCDATASILVVVAVAISVDCDVAFVAYVTVSVSFAFSVPPWSHCRHVSCPPR